MHRNRVSLDCAKLLGFANAQETHNATIDFKNKTIDARIGAKVGGGGEVCVAADLREMGLKLPSERSNKG